MLFDNHLKNDMLFSKIQERSHPLKDLRTLEDNAPKEEIKRTDYNASTDLETPLIVVGVGLFVNFPLCVLNAIFAWMECEGVLWVIIIRGNVCEQANL